MQIRVGLGGQIVVDGQVDPLNINTTAKDVGSNADALVELLELLVPADTMLMSVTRISIRVELAKHTAPPG